LCGFSEKYDKIIPEVVMQIELKQPGPLLDDQGRLSQVGWSRFPILESNLEAARFYRFRAFQRFRIKRWDYYAVFTPQRFFSATIADLGYAGNIFVYTLDFTSGELHEEGLVIPLGKGIILPRGSMVGETHFADKRARLTFQALSGERRLTVDWPTFHDGRGIHAELTLSLPPEHQSMNIVIPIGKKRFYYNTKINCMPVQGKLIYGDIHEQIEPDSSLASLDWGRGVWEYQSFWNWASASGFLPDGRTIGVICQPLPRTACSWMDSFISSGRCSLIMLVGATCNRGSSAMNKGTLILYLRHSKNDWLQPAWVSSTARFTRCLGIIPVKRLLRMARS